MDSRTYWLDLFTGTTWEEFLDTGAKVSGFRDSRWPTVKKIKPGDYLLCYITGISRFIGVLEVTSKPYKDSTPIWQDEEFPCRVEVKLIDKLDFETAVPVQELKDDLSCFQNMKGPNAWTGAFRGSPKRWSAADGEAVARAISEAVETPITREVDQKKLAYRPKAIKSKIGNVTIPEAEEPEKAEPVQQEKEYTEHTEIQYKLLKLGSDMGFHVWVARNDRGKDFKGKKFADMPRMKQGLPLQFDDATNKTIELIDVLWLQGNAILAAFEIESTTSIYSGLLRMSDLLAMQPNLNIPLYIVAPDERRDKVISEVNRPTFSKLETPLSETCRYLSFSSLRNNLTKFSEVIRHLKPEFLVEMSDSCIIEDV